MNLVGFSMRRLLPLLGLIAAAAPGVARRAPQTLETGTFAQRMADRWRSGTAGLPGRSVTAIRMSGDAVRVETDAGPAVLRAGRWQAAPAGESAATDTSF